MRAVPSAADFVPDMPIELANLLASRRPVVDVRLSDREMALALDRETMFSGSRRRVALATGSGRMWLEIVDGWIEDCLPPDTALPPIESLDPRLVEALIDVAVSPVCRSLALLLELPIGPGPFVEVVPPDLIRLSLLEPGEDPRSARLTLAMDDQAVEILIGALRRLPPDPAVTIAEAVPVRLHLLAGCRSLTLTEARALAPGAVVLLAGTGPEDGVGLAAGPRFCPIGRGQLSNDGVTIEALGDLAMAADPSTPEDVEIAPEISTTIEELEVRLDFVIGHATLRVADLREIAPGSTLALDGPPVDREVAIYSSGKRLGTGELVKIGDVMGVRLLSLAQRTDG